METNGPIKGARQQGIKRSTTLQIFLAASSRSRSIRSRGSAAASSCDQVETRFRTIKVFRSIQVENIFFPTPYYIEGRRTLFSACLGRRTLFSAHFGRRTLFSAYFGRRTLFKHILVDEHFLVYIGIR